MQALLLWATTCAILRLCFCHKSTQRSTVRLIPQPEFGWEVQLQHPRNSNPSCQRWCNMMEYVEVQFDRVLSSKLLSLLAFKYDTTNIFMCSHPSFLQGTSERSNHFASAKKVSLNEYIDLYRLLKNFVSVWINWSMIPSETYLHINYSSCRANETTFPALTSKKKGRTSIDVPEANAASAPLVCKGPGPVP